MMGSKKCSILQDKPYIIAKRIKVPCRACVDVTEIKSSSLKDIAIKVYKGDDNPNRVEINALSYISD